MEAGYYFHTDVDYEPQVSIPLVAAVADWIVEVDELVSADGTKSVLGSEQHEIHITQIGNELPVAKLFDQDGDEKPFRGEDGHFVFPPGKQIACSENPAEIVGWILKYAPGSGPKFPTTQRDAEVTPIDS